MVESTGDEFVLHELWTLTTKLSKCNLEGDHKDMLEQMIFGLELCSRNKTKETQRLLQVIKDNSAALQDRLARKISPNTITAEIARISNWGNLQQEHVNRLRAVALGAANLTNAENMQLYGLSADDLRDQLWNLRLELTQIEEDVENNAFRLQTENSCKQLTAMLEDLENYTMSRELKRRKRSLTKQMEKVKSMNTYTRQMIDEKRTKQQGLHCKLTKFTSEVFDYHSTGYSEPTATDHPWRRTPFVRSGAESALKPSMGKGSEEGLACRLQPDWTRYEPNPRMLDKVTQQVLDKKVMLVDLEDIVSESHRWFRPAVRDYLDSSDQWQQFNKMIWSNMEEKMDDVPVPQGRWRKTHFETVEKAIATLAKRLDLIDGAMSGAPEKDRQEIMHRVIALFTQQWQQDPEGACSEALDTDSEEESDEDSTIPEDSSFERMEKDQDKWLQPFCCGCKLRGVFNNVNLVPCPSKECKKRCFTCKRHRGRKNDMDREWHGGYSSDYTGNTLYSCACCQDSMAYWPCNEDGSYTVQEEGPGNNADIEMVMKPPDIKPEGVHGMMDATTEHLQVLADQFKGMDEALPRTMREEDAMRHLVILDPIQEHNRHITLQATRPRRQVDHTPKGKLWRKVKVKAATLETQSTSQTPKVEKLSLLTMEKACMAWWET